MRRTLSLLAVLMLAGSAAGGASAPQFGTWGFDVGGMDRAVKPGDDFNEFANGGWIRRAVIPADRSGVGAFEDLRVLSETRLKDIMTGLEARPRDTLSVEERKLVDLYQAFDDTKQIEERGLAPVKQDLALLSGVKTPEDVARAMASHRLGTQSVFGIRIGVDSRNSNAYSVDLTQSGIGMPDRTFYLNTDADAVKTRDAYRKFLTDMMGLAGMDHAAERAAAVFDLETRMARVEWDRADRRDRDKVYNPMTLAELKVFAPGFPWEAFLAEAGIPLKAPYGDRKLIVHEKSAFPALAQIFAQTPIAVWRDYLTVHYLHTYAGELPKKFDDTNFAFYGTVLGGNPEQLDRATRGVRLLDGEIGEALGKIYVAKYFPPQAKAKAEALVRNLLQVYESEIATLSWMSDATKKKALEKIRAFRVEVGYPDHWRDYSAYTVTRDDLVGDVQRGEVFEWNRELKRLDDPVDKTEWYMTPQTVNAYNSPSFVKIVFPAAILQPPFFDPNADDAVNYGGIGAVIGHEISHGFDDQGSKYTAAGNLENWWTPQDREKFNERTTMLVKQYDAFEVLPGLHVIGKNTLGENIADVSGLSVALKAYHLSLGGKPAPVIGSFSGDQRFFLGFAQIWRSKTRESSLRTRTLSNEHTVDAFRAIGATRNTDAWYAAFGVKPGDKYYLPPDQRVRIW
ncbi:MAG: M13 family metallopeptidase [Alphaproteobacteria bacterium]|nr:M13 family metallopeptidase [Alphaproteobacteria bacterium]